MLERFHIFGAASQYFQAIAYSATILFHMIPAITDFLRRLPVGDPFIDSFDSPVLQGFHLAFLALYLIGVTIQIVKSGLASELIKTRNCEKRLSCRRAFDPQGYENMSGLIGKRDE